MLLTCRPQGSCGRRPNCCESRTRRGRARLAATCTASRSFATRSSTGADRSSSRASISSLRVRASPPLPTPSRPAYSCHRIHSLCALLTCCLCRYHRCRQKGQPPAASHHQSGRSRPSSTRVLIKVYTHLQYRTTISKVLVHRQLAVSQVPPQLVQLIERCWSEHPLARPDFPRIKSAMRRINRCAAGLTR